MKYYYGNSFKEAISNDPVEIKSTVILQQYQDVYNVVTAVVDVDDEDDEDTLTMYLVTFDEDNQNLYSEFASREEAFEYAKENVANLPCVIKCWQSNKNEEFGYGEDYEEKNITDGDAELSKMIVSNIRREY